MKKYLRSLYRSITFTGLSIQQRLPLLVCLLLCSVILTFGFASYYGVKQAAADTGKNRLRMLADNLSTMFTQSSQSLITLMLATTKNEALQKNILSGGTASQNETVSLLNKIKKDSSWVLLDVLDSAKTPVLQSGYTGAARSLSLDTIFSELTVGPNTCAVGKIYATGDSMYYPVVASVTDKNKIIGYLVSWRLVSSTKQSLEQLSKLLGTGATLYVGNADGSLWTNLMKPVPRKPIDNQNIQQYFHYKDQRGNKVISAVQRIATTKWLVLVEFSEQTIMESANSFLNWIFIVGGILITLGILLTWIMSYNIIKPLNQLTASAIGIASGERTTLVKTTRLDELGKLVKAFNTMAEKIQLTQSDLETKIRERTIELETAKNEMESFSYSVSHDLRAPLRGIIGFTSILEEDYTDKLDDEAKRICLQIKKNTIKMGNLIDDLLAFSKLGRSDIMKTHINTSRMVQEIVDGLNSGEKIKWNIQSLPDIKGDSNAFTQVWVNLITNAVKYSQNKERPEIEIGTTQQGKQTVFFVKDNGVGFDQRYAGNLFKVFQRLHSSTEFEGTGIGLAIVEKVISKHAGRVWAEAEKEKGAVFYFEIPAE